MRYRPYFITEKSGQNNILVPKFYLKKYLQYNIRKFIYKPLSFVPNFSKNNVFLRILFINYSSFILCKDINGLLFITNHVLGFKEGSIIRINSLSYPFPVTHVAKGPQLLAKISHALYFKEYILLPSGKKIINTPQFNLGINLTFQKSHVSKSKVRGIAKNPIDHPNGGNSNTKGSFKNPWGSWAKKKK